MRATDPPLQQYLNIVKRQLSIVVLVPLLTVVAVNTLLEIKDPVYRAATTLVAGEPSGGERPPNLGTTSVTRTMTSLIEGDYVARNVIRKLRIDTTGKEFEKKLKVEVLPDTSVLEVSFTSTDPKLAVAVVTEIAHLFERRLGQSLGTSSGSSVSSRSGSFDLIVRQFDPPHVENDPNEPNVMSTLIIAGIAGLVLGLMLAVARDSLDFRIRGGKDAEEWFGAPVVGSLPKSGSATALTGVPRSRFGARRADPHAESLELLRARLQFSQTGIGGPTILVTSARPKEGKSSVTASLGVALARADARVICVDADLQRPNLHRYLGIEPEGPGLVEVLQGKVPLEEALVRVEALTPAPEGAPAVIDWESGQPDPSSRLEVLPAGGSGEGQSGLFTSTALTNLIAGLHQRADYVVFDSPPLVAADSFALARHCDNVLIVARRGRTTREHAEWARATLEGLGVVNISVVLTNAPRVEAYA